MLTAALFLQACKRTLHHVVQSTHLTQQEYYTSIFTPISPASVNLTKATFIPQLTAPSHQTREIKTLCLPSFEAEYLTLQDPGHDPSLPGMTSDLISQCRPRLQSRMETDYFAAPIDREPPVFIPPHLATVVAVVDVVANDSSSNRYNDHNNDHNHRAAHVSPGWKLRRLKEQSSCSRTKNTHHFISFVEHLPQGATVTLVWHPIVQSALTRMSASTSTTPVCHYLSLSSLSSLSPSSFSVFSPSPPLSPCTPSQPPSLSFSNKCFLTGHDLTPTASDFDSNEEGRDSSSNSDTDTESCMYYWQCPAASLCRTCVLAAGRTLNAKDGVFLKHAASNAPTTREMEVMSLTCMQCCIGSNPWTLVDTDSDTDFDSNLDSDRGSNSDNDSDSSSNSSSSSSSGSSSNRYTRSRLMAHLNQVRQRLEQAEHSTRLAELALSDLLLSCMMVHRDPDVGTTEVAAAAATYGKDGLYALW
ncbi:hypothetical protein EDD11_004880 [Mortierella claussenii]|nr:hypothetical protein EDD11_004880 [Mortierella claussenii]